MNLYLVKQDIYSLLAQRADLLEQKEAAADNINELDGIYDQLAAIDDTIESLEYDIEELVAEIAKDILNRTADVKAYAQEEERFHMKRVNSEKIVKDEKDFLLWLMKEHNQKKIQRDGLDIIRANNGGKQPIVYTTDAEDLPEGFKIAKTTYKPDDIAVRAFLDAGGESDLFYYGERGQNVRIK